MTDIKEFIGSVDPVKLEKMYKAEEIGDKKEYNRLKVQLLREYRQNRQIN